MKRFFKSTGLLALGLFGCCPYAPAQYTLVRSPYLSNFSVFADERENALLEIGIDSAFIRKHRVKTLTESFTEKGTALKMQQLQYDSTGRVRQRLLYVYGGLYATESYVYDPTLRTVTVSKNVQRPNSSSFEPNRIEPAKSWVIYYDRFGNPVRYLDEDYTDYLRIRDFPDSITCVYSYDPKGHVKTADQKVFFSNDSQPRYLHQYTYNNAGKVLTHIITNAGEQVFAVKNEYDGNTYLKKATSSYKYQLADTKEYFRNPTGQLVGIRQKGTLETLSTPFDKLLLIKYDSRGLPDSLYEVREEKAPIRYKWETY